MSYILDALRKADAERDRGNVPGIHAQPSFGGAQPAGAPPAAKPWLWLAGGAAAVLVVGGLAWYLTSPSRSAAEVPLTAPAIASGNAPANSPANAPATAPATALQPAPTGVAPPQAAFPVPAAAPPLQAPTQPTTQPLTPKTEATPPAVRKPKPTPAAASGAAVTDARAASSGEKIYAVAELPDDIRRQLPNVAVGGSMYSAKPADRILIINGQVLHEGDRIAPDLTLQQIRLKGAVLAFKDYRYTIGF